MPIFETVLTFVEDSGFIGDVLEAAADIGSDVFTTVGDTYFGLEQLNALNPVDPFFSGLDAAAGAYDTVGNFAGSSGFWDTFSPGSILDSATAAIDKFGGAIDQTLTQGFSALGNFDLAKTLGFAAPVSGLDAADQLLGQQILSASPLSALDAGLGDYASLGNFAGNTLNSALPFNDLIAAGQKVLGQTFNVGNLVKVAASAGPQVVNALFGGGTKGQLAAAVFRTGAGAVSGAINPQVTGPNAGLQLPVSQGTTVFDNSYGGGSAAEYNAINYSIQAQQIQDADAGVSQAQDNFDSQQRTYEAATESLGQATASVEAYDRLLTEPGLSEQEIADITAQRDAAAAQVQEAQYQVQVSQQDLVAAGDQLDNANNQYDQAVASANAQNLSPAQDPTNPAVPVIPTGPAAQNPGAVSPNDTNYLTTAAVNQAAQFIRTAATNVTDVANLPAATVANFRTVLAAAGIDPAADPGATQGIANQLIQQGLPANIANALVSAVNAEAQGLLDSARFQQAARAQQQNPAKTGDWRVRLSLAPGSNYLYNVDSGQGAGILQPLYDSNGVIFPYTPKVDTVYKADYESYNLTHSNYRGYFYKGSYVDNVSVQATFTAQDTAEASYLLAVIHFFRSATKMFYGQDALRGAPPPLVFLSGYGEYQFNNHPCVISSFNYNLPADVDYIRARSSFTNGTNFLLKRDRSSGVASNPLSYALQRLSSVGLPKGAQPERIPPPTLGINNPNYVPTKMDISLTLYPIQSRSQVSKQFSLQNFANGNLLKGGFW